MVNTAIVHDKRNEMLSLRSAVEGIQSSYVETANRRVALQRQLASILQCLQQQSNDDTALVEDAIIVSLQFEFQAKQTCWKMEIPEKPIIPANQPQGRTSNAEEALAVYTQQVDTLTKDRVYRQAMVDREASMVVIYQEGLERMLDVVDQYCQNETLRNRVQALAAA